MNAEKKSTTHLWKVKTENNQLNFFDISKGSIKPGQHCLLEYFLITVPFCVFHAWENVSMNIAPVI